MRSFLVLVVQGFKRESFQFHSRKVTVVYGKLNGETFFIFLKVHFEFFPVNRASKRNNLNRRRTHSAGRLRH